MKPEDAPSTGSEGSDEDCESQAFLKTGSVLTNPARFHRNCFPFLYAILSNILLIVVGFLCWPSRQQPEANTYEGGFDTDLTAIHPAIELQTVTFTGGLKFDDNGTLYRAVDPNEIQYVGEPSTKMDNAWYALIKGEGVDLVGEEADSVRGKTYQKPGGWWLTGVDMFHQLHCVDMVRKGLRPNHYTDHDPEPIYTMHLDHCIDYLRQSIQCSADLTTVPVHWVEEHQRVIQDFEITHTCRNFDKIHAWSIARDDKKHPTA